MIDSPYTPSLLQLLNAAMKRGAIRGWSIDGPNVVLYRCDEKYSVLPLVAGAILRDLVAVPQVASAHPPQLRFRITAE